MFRITALGAGALLVARLVAGGPAILGQPAAAPAADVAPPSTTLAERAPDAASAAAASTAAGSTAPNPSSTPTLDPAGVEAFVDGFMAGYLEESGAVGGVVTIVDHGRILLAKGYGEDDREHHRKVDARRTLFRVGSISKLFVWTAVMQLVEQGKVDLDADVNRYLDGTGVKVPATFKDPVTLAHLMTHTAGFEDHVLGLFAHQPSAVRPLRELLAAELPARVRAPGVVASYSNHGAALAMLVVEQVSGMPWAKYVETRILAPLGMKRTTFSQPPPDALRDDVSVGYRRVGGEAKAEGFEYVPLAPVGAMSATATDVARFMMAHLDLGRLGEARILSESAARRMQRTLHRQDPGVQGMAHGFIESDRNGRRVIGHGGDTLWFHSELELYPEQDVGIFVSFNTAGAEPVKLTKAFADRYFPAAQWSPQLAPAEWSKRARRFVGSYRSVRYSQHDLTKISALMNEIEVTDAGAGALRLSNERDARWVQVEPLLFREAGGTSTIAFREARRGGITHLFTSEIPVFAFERVPWYEGQRLHLAIAGVAALLFLVTVVAAPAGALLRRRWRAPSPKPQARLPLLPRATLWSGALVFLLFYVGLGLYMRDPMRIVFGIDASLHRLLMLPIVGAVLAALAVLGTLWIWRQRRGGAAARFAYTVVTIAFLIALWQLAVWRLIGHQG